MTYKKYPRLKKIISIIFLGLGLVACSDFLQGKPNKPEFIEVKKESLACLKDVSARMKQLLKAEAQPKKVEDTFACLDNTLVELQSRVQGTSEADAFSQSDLFKIFDQFVHDAKITNESTSDLLKLKTALLGGNEQKITKLEIGSLRELLKKIKIEVLQLLPYGKIYTNVTNEAAKPSKETITQAYQQLEVSLNNIVKSTQLMRSEYEFADFKKLILNLKFFDNQSGELFDLALEVKNLLVGNEDLRSANDYQAFIGSISQLLKLCSMQSQGYLAFEIGSALQLNDTLDSIGDAISILENSIQFKKTKLISVETLDPLIAKVSEINILPIKLKATTLLQFYKIVMVRAFQSGLTGDPLAFTGLQKIHFVNIRRELTIFRTYLASINSLEALNVADRSVESRVDISEAQTALRNFNFSAQAQFLGQLEPSERDLALAAVDEYKSEFLSARPVVYRFNKMVIAANQDIWKQSWQDLARAAYIKFLARSLIIGWGNGNINRLVQSSYITEGGLVKWYGEFKQFCIEIKLFDPRALNSGAKSFKEANLFPYSADGNDKMDFMETVQYLSILATGGGQIFGEIKNGLAKAGCNLQELDAFGFPWNQEACTYTDLRKNYKYYFNNLSYLVAYLDQFNEQQFQSFYEAVMVVARNDQNIKGKIESADLRNFVILMHYIESIYAQYDVDRNWNISAAEIRSAYPRFMSFATEFAFKTAKNKIDIFNSPAVQTLGYGCYSEQDLIRESFIYLVFKGTTPGITDLNIAPCFGSRSLIDFTGEVDRKTILNTFKILKAVLGS